MLQILKTAHYFLRLHRQHPKFNLGVCMPTLTPTPERGHFPAVVFNTILNSDFGNTENTKPFSAGEIRTCKPPKKYHNLPKHRQKPAKIAEKIICECAYKRGKPPKPHYKAKFSNISPCRSLHKIHILRNSDN